MLYLLHGNDVSATRNYIVSFIAEKNAYKKEVSLADFAETNFLSEMLAVSMFDSTYVFVIDVSDNFDDIEATLEVFSTAVPQSTDIILFSGKTIPKNNKTYKSLVGADAKVVSFKKEENTGLIFKFVDSVFELNRKKTYLQAQQLFNQDVVPFYIFSMLLYGLRNVAHAKFNSAKFNKMSPFVKNKSKKQAENFTEAQVLNLFEVFYKLDVKVKTGVILPDLLVSLAIESVLTYS
jgi:DNA polymerase III delta subunit